MTITLEDIKRGDTPDYEFTMLDLDGGPLDLTTATGVRFAAKTQKEVAGPDSITQFNEACVIEAPASAGIVTVSLDAADTDTVGKFIAELQTKFPGAKETSSEDMLLNINQDVLQG